MTNVDEGMEKSGNPVHYLWAEIGVATIENNEEIP